MSQTAVCNQEKSLDKENYCKATIKNCFIPINTNCFGLNLKHENYLSNFALTPLMSTEKKDSHTYFSIVEILEHPNIELFNAIFSSVINEIIMGK